MTTIEEPNYVLGKFVKKFSWEKENFFVKEVDEIVIDDKSIKEHYLPFKPTHVGDLSDDIIYKAKRRRCLPRCSLDHNHEKFSRVIIALMAGKILLFLAQVLGKHLANLLTAS